MISKDSNSIVPTLLCFALQSFADLAERHTVSPTNTAQRFHGFAPGFITAEWYSWWTLIYLKLIGTDIYYHVLMWQPHYWVLNLLRIQSSVLRGYSNIGWSINSPAIKPIFFSESSPIKYRPVEVLLVSISHLVTSFYNLPWWFIRSTLTSFLD